jgi:hypothetical protein
LYSGFVAGRVVRLPLEMFVQEVASREHRLARNACAHLAEAIATPFPTEARSQSGVGVLASKGDHQPGTWRRTSVGLVIGVRT